MEVVMSTQEVNALFASLGCPVGEDYIVGDDCRATLEEILLRLLKEDKYVRGFRRLISNSQVLKKDLLPLFYNVKNDYKILDLIIEILENLMIPVECLMPIDIMIREDAGRNTICQLNWLLTACKEAFLNPSSTKCVIDYIKLITKKPTTEGCRSINLCLLLLRNLLHIPEVRGGAPGGGASHQNQIIWNLFTQHIDKVLIQLMTSSSRGLWCLTIVQLISLLYKDQHSKTICRLLNTWCDTALSETSEDDESNTSPQDQGSGDSSSSMSTSDPADSSDSDHQKHKMKTETEVKHQPHSHQSHQHQQSQPHQHPHGHLHPNAKQATQNRMSELFAKGVGRKAQVAMRNKHNAGGKSTHPVKHRQLDHTLSQDLHPCIKAARICCSSESGIGSSICSGKMECGSLEESECGYNTQNQETISTSSNEDKEPCRFGKKKQVHQKPLHKIQKTCYSSGKSPLSSQARKDLYRKKLVKRSKTTTMSIMTFLNHTPSEEDISHMLKEFTIDFLLKGYHFLVSELKAVILVNKDVNLDTSHFTWLITFFLRFATQLEIDLDMISPVLSYDLIAYLTYEGVSLSEELEMAKLQPGENLTRTLQRLHLIVTSLKEIIVTIDAYRKFTHLTKADHEYLKSILENMARTNDLKYLFILLLRNFDPLVQSYQFLQDVVVANHNLLMLIENFPLATKESMAEHIKHFATEDVIKQYGLLLACFEENGDIINNCIFTIMHHVAGDLEKVSVLFQPSIIKSFTKILETDFQIRDDWSDLVEYVIQKCFKTKQIKVPPNTCLHLEDGDVAPAKNMPRQANPPPAEDLFKEWTKEESDSLCWFFSQSMETADPIGSVIRLFEENCGQKKTRSEVIENLMMQGLIQDEQYKYLIDQESPSDAFEKIQNNSTEMDILEGIQVIVDYLHKENCGFFVKWVQSCLLETCYARLVLRDNYPQQHLVEPVAYFNTRLNQPVPLVTWNEELWKVMQLEPSFWLLSALNFSLPTRSGQAKIFARIPAEWTVDHLYVAALILGPLDSSNMKFDPSHLQVIKQTSQSLSNVDQTNNIRNRLQDNSSLFGFFLGSSSMADWLQKVKQLKSFSKVQHLEDKLERMSMISGDERDWDLTSMCVSDEGRHEDADIPITIDAS